MTNFGRPFVHLEQSAPLLCRSGQKRKIVAWCEGAVGKNANYGVGEAHGVVGVCPDSRGPVQAVPIAMSFLLL